eukprot:8070786-Heterocapsa_arctica.AAC.1
MEKITRMSEKSNQWANIIRGRYLEPPAPVHICSRPARSHKAVKKSCIAEYEDFNIEGEYEGSV